MKYHSVLDLHTHTIVSGHAYCTLREMAKAASEKGLELLGITEHAPKMPGTCHKFYFENLRIVPREMYGIELLLGSEVNILDAQGTVDLSQRTMEKLDIIIASLHTPCMTPGSRQENTDAYLNAMKNPCINIIGHPDDGRYEVDYEARHGGSQKKIHWESVCIPEKLKRENFGKRMCCIHSGAHWRKKNSRFIFSRR